MSELLKKADASLIPENGRLIVGFSGGADSTALTHWLYTNFDSSRIILAHLNHMLRGEESLRDEAAVRAFADKLGLRAVVARIDIAALSKERGIGLEECGRSERYAFFESLTESENDRILTAHTLNDNAETFILHLSRGAGLFGLCGIPKRRGRLIRPFLNVSREDIEAYCAENGLSYVQDSTNSQTQYARNRVRLEILPAMKKLNPRVMEAIGQAASLLSADRDFIEKNAERLLNRAKREYGLDVKTLLSADEDLRLHALRLWLTDYDREKPERKHLEAVNEILESSGAVPLPDGVTARVSGGLLSLQLPKTEPEFYRIPVDIGENALPDGRTLIIEQRDKQFIQTENKIHNLDFKNAIDCDIIAGNLEARLRMPGDCFVLSGKKAKSLKEVFRESGVPAHLRSSRVLLVCGSKIVYCEGIGASADCRAAEKSESVLFISVKD